MDGCTASSAHLPGNHVRAHHAAEARGHDVLPGVCGGRVQVRLGLAQAGRLPPAGCASGHALRSSGSLRTALLYSCTPRPSDAPTIVLVAGICARLPGTPDAGRLKGGTRCPSGAAGAQEVARSRRTRRGAHERCIQSGTVSSTSLRSAVAQNARRPSLLLALVPCALRFRHSQPWTRLRSTHPPRLLLLLSRRRRRRRRQ